MTGAHGLVGRYGEERAVNDPAFNARPGIVTGVLSPHITAATSPRGASRRRSPATPMPAPAVGAGGGAGWLPGGSWWLTVLSAADACARGSLAGNHL